MKKLLFIGLDAAEPSLVELWMSQGLLPNIKKLREQGVYARIGTPEDHMVGLPWPTFYTGTNSGSHGVYHYLQWNPEKMKTERISRNWLPMEPFWQKFKHNDPKALIVEVPFTPGPKKFNGIEISGWGSHERLVPLFSYPENILDWIEKEIGPPPFFEEYFNSLSEAELIQTQKKLVFSVKKLTQLTKALIKQEEWDLLMLVYSATHRGGHQLWGQNDGGSENKHGQKIASSYLKSVYFACDKAVGELLKEVGDDVTILICSLHGMGFNQSRTSILNEMTARIIRHETGRHQSQQPGILSRIRDLVPPAVRHGIKRHMPVRLQDALTTFWRMGGTDWKNLPVICLVGDHDGYLQINLKGRESEGIVEPGHDFNHWVEIITRGLNSFVDADTGEPVVKKILKVDELNLSGESLHWLPDLIVKWQNTPAFKHREIRSPAYGSIAWPTPGRNPEGRTGNHRPQGFLIARGKRFQPGSTLDNIKVIDLAPTILDIIGSPVPSSMEGTVLSQYRVRS